MRLASQGRDCERRPTSCPEGTRSTRSRQSQELHRRPCRAKAEPGVEFLRPNVVVRADPEVPDVAGCLDCRAGHGRAAAVGGLRMDVDLADLGRRTMALKLGE